MERAEHLVLNSLLGGSKNLMQLENLAPVSIERLLHEMGTRQNLIYKEGNKWRITNLGEELIRFYERSE